MRNGYFSFGPNESDVLIVAPFLSANNLLSGMVSYEIHEGHGSENVFSFINSIIHHNGYPKFSARWLLATTWKSMEPFGLQDEPTYVCFMFC